MLKIPPPVLQWTTIRCVNFAKPCQQPSALIVYLLLRQNIWVVDGECSECGHDFGLKIQQGYPLWQGEKTAEPRPQLRIEDDICPACHISMCTMVKRGEIEIARSCFSCGSFVLPSGVYDAYITYQAHVMCGLDPFARPNPLSSKPLAVTPEPQQANPEKDGSEKETVRPGIDPDIAKKLG